ncbi:formin-binding protein 1-like Cip4 isoform X2 [Dermatophagoides pteronyssinus]|uniref:formin-binding protein 1-like Cip4 isoform X2 n=1 Tax=Dermatophagoides pteronyssinus TaxID=6956 RepID=UPI003F66D3D2
MQLLNLSLLSKRKQMYTSSMTIKSQASSSLSPSTSVLELSTSAPAKMSGSIMAINMAANMNNNSNSSNSNSNSNRSSMVHSPVSLKSPTVTNQTMTMAHHHYSFDFVSLLDLDDDFHRTLNLVKDQYDNIASHTNKSIDLLDKYGQFSRDLAAIEIDYAAKLRRLSKNYQIKRKDEEDNMCTVIKAFNKSLKEITDIAGQHEIIAEELSLNIVKEIGTVLKELKDERKRYLQEGTKLQNSLQQTISMLEKSKRSYEKAFRESEKAHENYLKADADLNLSRAEVEKARLISLSKSSMCDDAKSDYATHLQRTNDLQRQHYSELMPRVFHQLQDMEERRSQCIRNYIFQCAQIRQKVMPIIEKCIDGIVEASELINPKEDSRLVIEKYKSGVDPPGDFPFEDLSNPRCIDDSISNGDSSDGASVHSSNGSNGHNGLSHHKSTSGSTSLHYSKSVCTDTFRGTLSAAKFRKRGGIFGIFSSNKDDFSDLPPNQRRKRIQSKIDLIQSNIQQENGVREALLKMRQVYQDNPKLGDPQVVNAQLTECMQKLEKLDVDLKKYQTMLSGVLGSNTTPGLQNRSSTTLNSTNVSTATLNGGNNSTQNGQTTSNHRNSISDNSNDSVSRSESETSLHNHSNGSNGSPYGSSGGGSSVHTGLMQAANSLFNKYSMNPSATTPTSPFVKTNGNSNAPTTNGGSFNGNFFNGKAKSDQDISLNESSHDDQTTAPNADEEDFEETLIVLGTAKALYAFEGQDEGSINMDEGEEFDLIELDQGDGWTRVRRLREVFEEGFVPTTYIECNLYDNNLTNNGHMAIAANNATATTTTTTTA